MKNTRKTRCRCCGQLYQQDPRVHRNQKYCSRAACRNASKNEAQRRWRNSTKGRDYFQGSANVLRVKAWRRKNPGYWKRQRKRKSALQDQSPSQVNSASAITHDLTITALQDQLELQSTLLLGLVAKFVPSALQDEMDQVLGDLLISGRKLQQKVEQTAREKILRTLIAAEPRDSQQRRRPVNGVK